LYEALTGRVPYPGTTPEEVSAAHHAEAVRPPSEFAAGVPSRLDDVILQALRRDPSARFHTADAMASALGAAAEDAPRERDDDTTRIVRTWSTPPQGGGYVPPPLPAAVPTRPPARRPARQVGRGRNLWPLVGTLLVLGAAALVVMLVVLPLLQLGEGGGGPSGSASPGATAPSDPNLVNVPQVVGLPTAQAIAAAQAAGLDWTVHCDEDPAQPEGIIDQEPPAGRTVARGSPFAMFSARFADCQG
ncbi:MAG: PASTA domain-containing protein, partial [Candidatus Limnocylindria bacterium]